MATRRSAKNKGLYQYPKRIGKILEKWYWGSTVQWPYIRSWLGEDPKNRILMPSVASGGQGQRSRTQAGDLAVSTDFLEKFPVTVPWVLSVELKHDMSWEWRRFIQNPDCCELSKYWNQCYIDASDANALTKYPLVIFTKNYEKDYAMFLYEGFETCFKDHQDQPFLFTNIGVEIGVTTLDNFLECCNPQKIRDYFS